MFEKLEAAPPDPILALAGLARADTRPQKLDLGIGIYLDEDGNAPVMAAVRRAEQRVLDGEVSKAYLPASGNAAFLERLGRKVFGEGLWTGRRERFGGIQSTGCVAALRLGAEVLRRAGCRRIWVSDPTWPIHDPIFLAAGLEPVSYPYYSVGAAGVAWDEMVGAVSRMERGDAILLHAGCHNPSGADPTIDQWDELAKLLRDREVLPFFDVAYAGLGYGWDEDLAGVRALVEATGEALIAVSCSKSFALYRERTGALYFMSRQAQEVGKVLSNAMSAARTNYSMPPDHGAAAVAELLGDSELEAEWLAELGRMRTRIGTLRETLVQEAFEAGLDWRYLRDQRGMFSLLPLDGEQVVRLRDDFGIYMPTNGRICIPALARIGAGYLAKSCGILSWMKTAGSG
ncbi:MAG: aspartate/tyrosine/aromatic aminotransferase [Novosphingobium sp.]|nr:aspartate/tyrosine/aromatic aminotransferase [Novosphingobium sp.]